MRRVLHEYNFTSGESKIHMKSDSREVLIKAAEEIKQHRRELLHYINEHPEFRYAMHPVDPVENAPRIVRVMASAASKADVGPMASVAGALADVGLRSMLKLEASIAIVENGGEIAAFTKEPIIISILSGDTVLSNRIGFCLNRENCPIGIATSSSRTSRTLSFGEADSVTIVADDASLADAAATAICNSVIGLDIKESIKRGLERAKRIDGVRGVLIIREGYSGIWGNLPRIVRIT
ncbi:UPF0280 family protein [Candidatus Bathyarchaeota archaeon]|nr:MAG: UPF0280 family protein [Candidatus Bathyarchaeota archaeon]